MKADSNALVLGFPRWPKIGRRCFNFNLIQTFHYLHIIIPNYTVWQWRAIILSKPQNTAAASNTQQCLI